MSGRARTGANCFFELTAENIKVNMAAACRPWPDAEHTGNAGAKYCRDGSAHNEAAAVMLALGAPAINRPLMFERPRADDALSEWLKAVYSVINCRAATGDGIVISAAEYMLAAAAESSTIATMIELDLRTVSG